MRCLRWGLIFALVFATVIFVRIGLWLTRYQILHRLIVRPCNHTVDETQILTVRRISITTARVSRFVPGASCLTQSIACQALLSWKKIPSTISIGVHQDFVSRFEAHAWLSWNGAIVLGAEGQSVSKFSKILEIQTPLIKSIAPVSH